MNLKKSNSIGYVISDKTLSSNSNLILANDLFRFGLLHSLVPVHWMLCLLLDRKLRKQGRNEDNGERGGEVTRKSATGTGRESIHCSWAIGTWPIWEIHGCYCNTSFALFFLPFLIFFMFAVGNSTIIETLK